MPVTAEMLVQCGFVETVYPDQGPEKYFLKTLLAREMPEFFKTAVDNEWVFPDDRIAVEVCPDGTVQWISQEADVSETGIPVDSGKGMGLLRDAGYKI